MKILFLPTNVAGVNFWRMHQYWEQMRERGVDSAMYHYSSNADMVGQWEMELTTNIKLRQEIYNLLMQCDVCVLQYAHVPMILALIIMFQEEKRLKKKFVCEIDDYVLETPEYNPAFKSGWKPGVFNEKVVIEQLKVSDAVVVSTPFLGECYKKMNSKIEVIPNAIDFKRWDTPKKKHTRTRIGWIGGGNHEEDLRILQQVVPVIIKKYKNVEFYFGHGAPKYIKDLCRELPRCQYDTKWVNIEKYPKRVAELGFDIGMAPLVDNIFNRAKSNLRWLEYSALKIPTVASDIEPYQKSIVNGDTGYLATTVDDWVCAISLLVENSTMRKLVGGDAYGAVKKDFNVETVAKKYIKFLEGLKNEQGKPKGRDTSLN